MKSVWVAKDLLVYLPVKAADILYEWKNMWNEHIEHLGNFGNEEASFSVERLLEAAFAAGFLAGKIQAQEEIEKFKEPGLAEC